MTREETKSCIGTIKMLQRLAYNIHGVMDVIDADNCKKIIKALEQTRWIPVSERLPEKDSNYLAYIVDPYDVRERYSMTCEFFAPNSWCPDDECSSSNVVAWMPLPEPYKAESEDKE